MVVGAIQSEWILLQRVTKDVGQVFAGVGKVMWENVLPHIFFGRFKTLSPILG